MKFYSTIGPGVLLFALLSMTVALPAMQESEDNGMLESAMRYIENAIAMDKLEQVMKSAVPSDDDILENVVNYIDNAMVMDDDQLRMESANPSDLLSDIFNEEAQDEAVQQEQSGFRHIYSLDMQIPGESCPENLKLRTSKSLRMCERRGKGKGCNSVTIRVPEGQTYQEVRGRVKGYQWGTTDAFKGNTGSIDGSYVDGVSITHGQEPRKHIYTLASAIRISQCKRPEGVPKFVTNYTCSSGNLAPAPKRPWWKIPSIWWKEQRRELKKLYNRNPLWTSVNGDCSDLECNDSPFFCVKLPEPTTDDIELRVCRNQDRDDENVFLEAIDVYIK